MPDFKRIMILLENSSGAERAFSRGISRYARDAHRKWHLMNVPEGGDVFKGLSSWNAHGAIGMASTLKTAAAAMNLSFPFVNLFTRRIFRDSVQVGPDHRALGRMAAEHLMSLGFRNLAFITRDNTLLSDPRLEGFRERVEGQGVSLHTVRVSERPMEDERLLDLIRDIPKPAAFCASTDGVARGVLRACRELDMAVPDRVAILGINNNPLFCEGGFIPLSSVSWPADQVGYEAAQLLDRLIKGGRPPREPLLLPPTEVIVRQSTDVFAVDDEVVARALRLIREKAKDRIRIKDVVTASGVGRRTLETRFRIVMQRGIHDEIRRVQLSLARKALRETAWPMERVAMESGFGGGVHMGLEFKKHLHISPGAYRKQFGLNRPEPSEETIY